MQHRGLDTINVVLKSIFGIDTKAISGYGTMILLILDSLAVLFGASPFQSPLRVGNMFKARLASHSEVADVSRLTGSQLPVHLRIRIGI